MNLQVKFSEGTEAFNGKLDEDDLSVRAGFGETQNIGTTKHNELSNRNFADQHPITAITGLEEALAEKLPASDFVLGTTEGTAYEGSAGQKNADDIAFVKQVLIENGTISKIEVEQAYTSRVTASGENIVDGQKTPVTLIKGKTVRCENLLGTPYLNPSGTVNRGITWTYDEYGVITVNGTATAISSRYLMRETTTHTLKKAGTYTISMVNGSSSYYLEIAVRDFASGTWLWGKPVYGGSYTFTLNEGEYFVVQIRVAAGVTANNQKIYVMLNEGSTALPWQPYFTDLKHAKINSIVSTGKNLLDISKFVGGALVDNGDGTYTFTKNGNSRFSAIWEPEQPLYLGDFYPRMEVLSETIAANGIKVEGFTVDGTRTTFNLQDVNSVTKWIRNNPIVQFRMFLNGDEQDGAYITFKNPAFSRDKTYTPFVQETYQLPETLELGEWDTFNPQTGEIMRGTGRVVFDGTENWKVEGAPYGGNNFYSDVFADALKSQNVISTHYNSNIGISTGLANNIFISKTGRLNVTAADFSTVDEWKTYLQEQATAGTPLIVEYKLATPTVEKLENATKTYTVYNQGNETAVLENAEFGAIPTITNEYFKLKES